MDEPRSLVASLDLIDARPETADGDGIARANVLAGLFEDSPRQRLGRFEIQRLLGSGAMGSVFEVRNDRAPGSSNVALKVINRVGPERLYRFKREFRSLARLDHPNLVTLYDLTHTGDQLFFTMELLDGAGLTGALKATRGDFDRVREVFGDLAAGLNAIHAAGMVHRDIKPSNVILTRAGRVVILDMGLVQESDVLSLEDTAGAPSLVGTPMYMAPEQMTGAAKVGPPADLYSVGEMLFEALTGTKRLAGKSLNELVTAKVYGTPTPPSTLNDEVPADLDELCVGLLAREPKDRPSAQDLRKWLGLERRVEDVRATGALLGRTGEVAALLDAFDRVAETGRPVVALVSGTSGVGKSALVHHVLDLVRSGEGALSFESHGSERESIPYKAVDSAVDATALYLRGKPAVAQAVVADELRALSRLFPVLDTVPEIRELPESPVGGDPVVLRRQAFGALARLWGRLAERGPVVVSLDDLQWADYDSVQLLESVLVGDDPPPVLFVASYRAGTEEVDGPLKQFVESVRQAELARVQLDLRPLDERRSKELARRLLGDSPAELLVHRIAREAAGSPFFIEELSRAARDWQAADDGSTPDTALNLDEFIRRRVAKLPEVARRLLTVVSVAGGSIPRSVGLELVGASMDRAIMGQLRAAHLLRGDREGSSGGLLETYHDRVREAVSDGVPEADKPELHGQIARALVSGGNADPHALAHHFRAAGEVELGTRHTIEAAEHAERMLAFDQAAGLYRTALDMGAFEPAREAALRGRLGAALGAGGHLLESARAYVGASRIESGAGADEQAAWLRQAAENLLTSGHTDEGRTVLEEALAREGMRLPTSIGGSIASLIGHRIAIQIGGSDFEAREAADVPPATARRLDGLWTASRGLMYTDGILGALLHARSLREALKVGDVERVVRALAFEQVVVTALNPKKVDSMVATLDQLQALAIERGHAYAEGMVEQTRAASFINTGRFGDSWDATERALAIFRERCTGVMQEIGYTEAHGSASLLFMGRVRELRSLSTRMLRHSTEHANPYVEGFARGMLHHCLLAMDSVGAAKEQIEIYRRDAPRNFEAHLLNVCHQETALARYQGRPEEAWLLVQRDWPRMKKTTIVRAPCALVEMLFSVAQSAVAWAAQAPDPKPMLATAATLSKRLKKIPLPSGAAYGGLIDASLMGIRGDEDACVAKLKVAIRALEASEMGAFCATAQRRLAERVGGDEATELRARSDAWMAAEGIVSPARFTEMMAPGA